MRIFGIIFTHKTPHPSLCDTVSSRRRQEKQKTADYVIDLGPKESLAMEIACALKDVFVASVEVNGETLEIAFLDGKTFQLIVKEK